MRGCRETLDAQAVGKALYDLQGMDCRHSEVVALFNDMNIKVLEFLIMHRLEIVNAHIAALILIQGASKARFHLGNSSIKLIIEILNQQKKPLSMIDATRCLYGIKALHAVIRDFISTLSHALKKVNRPFSAQGVRNAL